MNEMAEKICPECGAAFVPRNSSQVSCSDECKRNRLRRQIREWAYEHGYIRHHRQVKLSARQQMFVNLQQRDAIAPKPRTEIIYNDGIIIERRGFIPAGVGALRRVCC